MSQESLSGSQKPTVSMGHRTKKWLAENWLSLASLIVSFLALYISANADSRTQHNESAIASAEATLLTEQTAEVYMIATYAHTVFVHAQNEQAKGGELSPETISEFAKVELPPLSPTLDELEQLARTGDDTATRLALCVKWRNLAEGTIEPLAENKLIPQFRAMYVNEGVSNLSRASQACYQAAEGLDHHAVRDPSGKDIFSQPVVLKRIPAPLTPPHAASMN